MRNLNLKPYLIGGTLIVAAWLSLIGIGVASAVSALVAKDVPAAVKPVGKVLN